MLTQAFEFYHLNYDEKLLVWYCRTMSVPADGRSRTGRIDLPVVLEFCKAVIICSLLWRFWISSFNPYLIFILDISNMRTWRCWPFMNQVYFPIMRNHLSNRREFYTLINILKHMLLWMKYIQAVSMRHMIISFATSGALRIHVTNNISSTVINRQSFTLMSNV